MPTATEHNEKFNHKTEFDSYIKDPKFSDWQITACFYSALHLVQLCLHDKYGLTDNQMTNHNETKDMVAKYLSSAEDDYDDLLSLSYTSRYKSVSSQNSCDCEDAMKCLQNIVDICNSLYGSHNRFKLA